MKFDLVMWTKDAGFNLRLVLDRIDRVIPKEAVGQKIMIDDGSLDNTKFVGIMRGWTVIPNRKGGISAAANQALEMVKSPIFFSFEQDVVLSPDWFRLVVPRILGKEGVAAASGVRFTNCGRSISNFERIGQDIKPAFTWGKTLDNTAWNTKILRGIGGFPTVEGTSAGVDNVLAYLFLTKGFKWLVEDRAVSIHLRKGVWDEIGRKRGYGDAFPKINRTLRKYGAIQNDKVSMLGTVFRLAKSPITGLLIALKTGDPNIVWIYPAIRFQFLLGLAGSGLAICS